MDKLLAGLKDIHLPADQQGAIDGQYVLWPFMVFAALCAMVVFIVRRRKTLWRRQVEAELAQIEKHSQNDPTAAWQRLAMLLRRVAIHFSAHDKITNPSTRVTRVTGEPWLQRLDQLFGCDTFTSGAGRELINIPYLAPDIEADAVTRQTEALPMQQVSSVALARVVAVVRRGLRAMPEQ